MTRNLVATKTGISALAQLPRVDYRSADDVRLNEPALYQCQRDGLTYDFIVSPAAHPSNELFLLFSGNMDREKMQPPVFQRWSWAKKFAGHCLFFSDPTLHLGTDFGLSWYCGTTTTDPMPVIAELALGIAGRLGIAPANLLAYGSSGGGFAALRLATLVPELSVVVINPQTDVTRYRPRLVQAYLNSCLGGIAPEEALQRFPRRFSIIENIDLLRNTRILYYQNRKDRFHINHHMRPFAKRMRLKAENDYTTRRCKLIMFDKEGGHSAAETEEIFSSFRDQMAALA